MASVMPEQSAAKNYNGLYTPLAIVVAGALIGGGLFFGLSGGGATGPSQPSVNIKDVKIDGEPYIGKVDAKVVLAYWSDYQCPYCRAVEVGGIPQISIEPALPILIRDYVNTGKLKIVFKDYPFLGEDSITAALYEHAIWKLYPDKFYSWREAMFKAQDDEGDAGFGDEASIIALIKTIAGIDANAVKANIAANRADYQKKIDADRAEGTKFGINGTPGFITGKTLIPGAAELATFKTAIDPQL